MVEVVHIIFHLLWKCFNVAQDGGLWMLQVVWKVYWKDPCKWKQFFGMVIDKYLKLYQCEFINFAKDKIFFH